MASSKTSKGVLFRKKLPFTCSPGGTVSKKPESEQPMDLTEESVGDTDSVSSEDSYSVLCQSSANLDLPVKLTREDARQNFAAIESESPGKTVG